MECEDAHPPGPWPGHRAHSILLIFFPRRQKLQIVPSQQVALPTEPRIESVQKHAVRYRAYRSLSLKSRHCLCQMLRQHGKRDVAVMLFSSSSSRFSVANGRWMNRTEQAGRLFAPRLEDHRGRQATVPGHLVAAGFRWHKQRLVPACCSLCSR